MQRAVPGRSPASDVDCGQDSGAVRKRRKADALLRREEALEFLAGV